MNKLAKLIQKLEPKELLLLQKDLDAGNIERLISAHLARHADARSKQCPVCGMHTTERGSYKLEFGPADLRQKAHFDALDCLRYFMENNLTTA